MLESVLQGKNLKMCTIRPEESQMSYHWRLTLNLSGASGNVFVLVRGMQAS